MTAPLTRLHPHDRYPRDAVIVTVRKAMGRVVADVAAVEVIADFPMPVPAALKVAEDLRRSEGLSRIAVVVADEDWRPQWGELVG